VPAILRAACSAGRRQLATHNGKEVCQVRSSSCLGQTRKLSLAEEVLEDRAAVTAAAAAEATTVEAAAARHHQVQEAAVGAHPRHQADHSGKIQDCLSQANAG
jgi:hypothetical protein